MFILVDPEVSFNAGSKYIIRDDCIYKSVNMLTGETTDVQGFFVKTKYSVYKIYNNVFISSGKFCYEDNYSKVLIIPRRHPGRHIDFNAFTGQYLSNFDLDFIFDIIEVVRDTGYYGYLVFGDWCIPVFKCKTKGSSEVILDSLLRRQTITSNMCFRTYLGDIHYNDRYIVADLGYLTMWRFTGGGANWFKKRLKVDLHNGVFTLDDKEYQGLTVGQVARRRFMGKDEW